MHDQHRKNKKPCRGNMALNSIVEDIRNSDGGSITYSNDGSAMNKVGSITVNGVQRALPALSIVTESHETLKQLEMTTLNMLSAAIGYRKYTEAEILKKITFVMTVQRTILLSWRKFVQNST